MRLIYLDFDLIIFDFFLGNFLKVFYKSIASEKDKVNFPGITE